jgi:outer membrane lipoprotein-sorting protein
MVRFLFIVILSGLMQAGMTQHNPMQKKDADRVKQYITEATNQVLTIQSEFIQEKEMSVLSEKIISKGIFYFKKEKQLRWEYLDPFKYLIVINNDKLLVRDDDSENRINLQTNKVFREINNIIVGAVQGTLLNDTKNFQSSLFDENSYYLCKLVPLNSKLKESLSEIWLYFNKNDYTVDKLDLRESSGDYTRITFVSKQLNPQLSDEKFFIR